MIKMLEIRILVERHVEIGLIAYIHMISVLKWLDELYVNIMWIELRLILMYQDIHRFGFLLFVCTKGI